MYYIHYRPLYIFCQIPIGVYRQCLSERRGTRVGLENILTILLRCVKGIMMSLLYL